jgi:prevent-host-death family protein
MTHAYDVTEAKSKFSLLIEQVERGAAVTITRHGKTVARILPAARRADFLEEIRRLRESQDKSAVSSVDLIRDLRDGAG